jgi:hypothetical protein
MGCDLAQWFVLHEIIHIVMYLLLWLGGEHEVIEHVCVYIFQAEHSPFHLKVFEEML